MADRYAFSARVRQINQYRTLAEMEEACGRVRKASWWGRVARNDETTLPPFYDDELDGIAMLFGTTREQVRAMITEEWFGVASTPASSRIKRLAPQIDTLTDADFDLIQNVANRLAPHTGDADWKPKTRG
jgi:hypothetical protein